MAHLPADGRAGSRRAAVRLHAPVPPVPRGRRDRGPPPWRTIRRLAGARTADQPGADRHGHHELATRLARQDTYPSWGYEVRQGATTIWERWNSWTPEDGFADPGMNSLNHAALGSVADWLHQHLAGLAPGTPGYRTMLVR